MNQSTRIVPNWHIPKTRLCLEHVMEFHRKWISSRTDTGHSGMMMLVII